MLMAMRGRQSYHDSSSHKACQLLDEKFSIALHEIKNQRIRHKQHVANTSKPKPIQCFQRRPWFINPVHESLFLQASGVPTIPMPQQPHRSML